MFNWLYMLQEGQLVYDGPPHETIKHFEKLGKSITLFIPLYDLHSRFE